ncbi:hypothetical protein BCT23_19850 [Enterovibrio norvegicus]|uniref:Glycosaminoglycan attachment site n=1 Tax=Enterovibrio norvegicus TaxID=188144 RepID=A0A2N7L8M0_9GAMM|nr:hypothetical protein BCT23_19850 [Enterovibrio norvegicus]
MSLFVSRFDKKKLHKNYLEVLRLTQQADRDEFESWFDGFPDRDGKLIDEFQTTFNSTFWEIYLHRVFKSQNAIFDWSQPTPDFALSINGKDIIVEATIASNTQGKTPEWEKNPTTPLPDTFRSMNVESIIRLANAVTSKRAKYQKSYKDKPHVERKPFVLAIAPFEQPNFNIQYETPMMALLYDYYIDEDEYNLNLGAYPNGPPGVSLGSVEKDNGSKIELGIFEDAGFEQLSAIIFSTTATWGKVEAMSKNPDVERYISTVWYDENKALPDQMSTPSVLYSERIQDGLMVFHNPYALEPLDPKVFEIPGVIQIFADKVTRKITRQRNGVVLMHRQVVNVPKTVK